MARKKTIGVILIFVLIAIGAGWFFLQNQSKDIVKQSGCVIQPIALNRSSSSFAGYTITLENPDDSNKPTAWQGPITISSSAGSCSVSFDTLGIITKPLFGDSRGRLWVPNYSGSNFQLSTVDPKTCKVVWQSEKFSAPISVKNNEIAIGGKELQFDDSCTTRIPTK